MAKVEVKAEIPKLPNGQIEVERRKDGDLKRRPITVFYNVFVDGKLIARHPRHYGLIDGSFKLGGAIESAEQDFLERYATQVATLRAIEELKASQFEKVATIEV